MVGPHAVCRSFVVRLVLTFLAFASLLATRGEVIYDNSARFLNQFFDERTEYGDQVDLEGTARRLRQILFEYYGRFTPNGDERVKVRVYANEKVYDRYRKEPTTLLFESDWMPIVEGYNTHMIDGLNIQLPLHTVTVTAEFSGIGEDEAAGLLFYDPPVVGYSFNEIWLRGATGLWVPVLYSTSDPMKRASVGMRLIAEPDLVLDQYNRYSESQRAMRHGTNRVRFAQTFSPEVSGRLSHVTLSMQFSNQPVRIRILDTVGQVPGPNVLGTINMLQGTGAPHVNYFIDQAIYLKAGSLYAIELSTAAENGPIPSHFLPVSRNNYSRGHLWSRNEDGGTWRPVDDNSGQATYLDAKFETYMIAAEPSAQLISPKPRATFDLNEPIFLEARHRPAEIGSIARVRFLNGTNEIASLTNAPYTVVWTNAPPGEHRLRAIAEDTFRRPFRSEAVDVIVRPAGSPPNDNFAQRLSLFGLAARSIKPATNATSEPGEPQPLPGYQGQTLWWSWTAYDRTPVTISAQNSSAADVSVAVFRGGAITNLVLVTNGVPQVRFVPEEGITYAIALEPRTSADYLALDIAAADVRVQTVRPPIARAGDIAEIVLTPSSARAITNVQIFAGTELLGSTNSSASSILVRLNASGIFNIAVVATDTRGIQTISVPYRFVVRPINDSFAHRGHLPGYDNEEVFHVGGGTTETAEPALPNLGAANLSSEWWSWTAPATGKARVDVRPDSQGIAIEVFAGTNLTGLTLVQQSTNGSPLEFIAQENEVYHLRVTGGADEVTSRHIGISLQGLRLVRPVNNQVFLGNTAVPLRAAFTGETAMTEIEFLANGDAITNLTIRDGLALWTNAAPGRYELRVRSKADPSLLSGPVFITVGSESTAFTNRIFAGAFSRTSFVLNESGEVLAFGTRPGNFGPIEHQNTFHPARAFAFPIENGWKAISANSNAWVGLDGNGALIAFAGEAVLDANTNAWADVETGPTTYAKIDTNGRLYLDDAGAAEFPAGVTHWLDVTVARDAVLALGDSGQTYVMNPQNGTIIGVIPRPSGVTNWAQIAAGATTAFLQGDDGEIFSLELSSAISSNLPLPVLRVRPPDVDSWDDFAVGGAHQLFLDDEGVLFASGRNLEGQLGIGRASLTETMMRVAFPPGVSRWTQVAAGELHSMAVGDDCRLYVWGSNAEGQLGLGRHIARQTLPVPIDSLGTLCSSPLRIAAPEILSGGDVSLEFETILNRPVYVEYSEDLIRWQRIEENIPADGFDANWIDTGAPSTGSHPRESEARFYRIVRP